MNKHHVCTSVFFSYTHYVITRYNGTCLFKPLNWNVLKLYQTDLIKNNLVGIYIINYIYNINIFVHYIIVAQDIQT